MFGKEIFFLDTLAFFLLLFIFSIISLSFWLYSQAYLPNWSNHFGYLGNVRWCLTVGRVQYSETRATFLQMYFLCLRWEMVLSVKQSSLLRSLLKQRKIMEKACMHSIQSRGSYKRKIKYSGNWTYRCRRFVGASF